MARNVISAKLDIIFKKIFTENQDMLREFLSDMLDIPISSIQEIVITNPEIVPEAIDGKFSRLDLNLKVDNTLVNVEIQIKSETDYRDRCLFYWSKLYTSELKSGETYGKLKKAITINIINFKMFEGNDYHTEVVTTVKGTNEIFSDKFSMHFFELKKVGKNVDSNNRKELWMQFLNADSEEDLEMLKQSNVPIITKAVSIIYDLSEDTKIREMARLREKALHDEASALANAKSEGEAIGLEKGEAIGLEKGKTEERAETIARMKSLGFTDEQINAIYSNNI